MGYEIRIRVGEACLRSPERKHSTTPQIEGEGENAYVWYPYLKDVEGEYIPTGRMEYSFLTAAVMDLCKCGDGPLDKLRARCKNKNEKIVYKWCEGGNTQVSEDGYGDRYKPVSLSLVIKALKEQIALEGKNPYRRFAWALAMCEAIEKTQENHKGARQFTVLFEGY